MKVANMRDCLLARYPGWNKVHKMPDDQVIAIYMRLARADDLARSKKQPSIPTKLKHFAYVCIPCCGTFEADNPELNECRFCGSTNIIKEEPK